MKRKFVPVGIFGKEIFIANLENGKIRGFDVLRPVTEEQLETLRDPDNIKDYLREDWKLAVQNDATESSLDDFVDEAVQEYDLDENEEMYPGKDESGLENLTIDERDQADAFMENEYDMTIGTWESSGWYAPTSTFGKEKYNGFDYVFDTPEAHELADTWQNLYD
jgi:hypothetical protein